MDLRSMRNIGVFRALQLGDMLCVVPALRALRRAAPHARIMLVGLPWAAGFALRFSCYIDAYMRFPGFPGLPEQTPALADIPAFIGAMQEQRFDLMLQMHGSGGLSNPLTATFGAACHAGFYLDGAFCPDPRHFMRWEERQHEILRNLQLLEFLGAPAHGEHLEFPLQEADFHALRRNCADLPAAGAYVCIHPGARLPSRRWRPARFAGVADGLRECGLEIILTGTAEESSLACEVQRAMRGPAINVCGKTGLGDFAALVAGARLVVCNDTGISHVAAALGTPSVVVCCGADPQRWAPLDGRRHRTLSAKVACRPCMHRICPTDHACAEEISAVMALSAARQVLADNPLPQRGESRPAIA